MRYYYAALVTALCALCVWGGFGLTKHLTEAIDRWGNAAPNFQPTLDALNRPCGNGHPCGLIANANKTLVKVGDAIVTTQLTERKATPHVTAAMDALKDSAVQLSGTANAATGSLTAATDALNEGKRTIQAAQPLLASYTRAGDSLNDLLRDRAIHQTVQNVADMTASGSIVMGNAAKVSTKLTNDFTAKKPWYRKLGPMAGDLFDYGALAARHTP